MTKEEEVLKADEVLKALDKITPDALRKVDKDVDHFVETFGDSIHAHAEQHKLEYTMLDKTIILCYTDAICIRHAEENDGSILGGIACIGDHEHLVQLYKALGEELRKKGILNEES